MIISEVIFILLLCCVGCSPVEEIEKQIAILSEPTQTSLPPFLRAIQEYHEVEPIWNQAHVNILFNPMDKMLDAGFGRVCYLGYFEDKVDRYNLNCFDSKDGTILWKNEAENGNNLAITPDGVFVAFMSDRGIRIYDSLSGVVIRKKSWFRRSPLYLYYLNQQIQIVTDPDVFYIFDTKGQLVQEIGGKKVLAMFPDMGITQGLRAFKTGTNEQIWEFDSGQDRSPLFTENEIFIRNGIWSGTLHAVDRLTGKELWHTSKEIISNVVYSPEKKVVYALRQDNDLIALNEISGEETVVVRFSSMPFVLANKDGSAYQVGYDESEHVLIVALGDSHQLFAFKEK